MNIQELFSNWGGVVGTLLGLLGGAFGTWCSIRNTSGPKERALMVKAAVWMWVLLIALLGLFFGLQNFLPGIHKLWSIAGIVLSVPALIFGINYLNRRQAQIRAEESPHAAGDPTKCGETTATAATGQSSCGSQDPVGTFLGIVFWMFIGALAFNSFTPKNPPQQTLRITNTGSQAVELRKLARWSWQEEAFTVHPGATVLWKFANVDHFRIARSDQPPPAPGTTPPEWFSRPRAELWPADLHHNADGSGTIMLRHVDRTAEVRINDDGKIEFKFTDL